MLDGKYARPFEQTLVNQSNFRMFIDPYYDREQPSSAWYTPGFSAKQVEFNWTLSAFNPPNLFVQLTFKEASAISPAQGGRNQDFLVVNITDANRFFKLPDLPLYSDATPTFCFLNNTIPKQLDNSAAAQRFSEGARAVKGGLKFLFFAGALLSLIGNWSFWLFLSLIRTYQLVMHLPMMRVTFPPNVMLFFEMMMPIAQFDVLEGIFGGGEEQSAEQGAAQFAVVDQMTELGYDNHNSFVNLSTMSLLIVFYLMRLVFYFSVKAYMRF